MKKLMTFLFSCLVLFALVVVTQEALHASNEHGAAIDKQQLNVSEFQNALKFDPNLERPQPKSLAIVRDQAIQADKWMARPKVHLLGADEEGTEDEIAKFKDIFETYKNDNPMWKTKLSMDVLEKAPFKDLDMEKIKSSSEANTGSGVGVALCTLYCTGYNLLEAKLNSNFATSMVKGMVLGFVTPILSFVISKYVVDGDWLNDRPVAQAFIVVYINSMKNNDDDLYKPMKNWRWRDTE